MTCPIRLGALLVAVALPALARAQPVSSSPPGTGAPNPTLASTFTLLTSPSAATVHLSGRYEIDGRAPLDLPTTVAGRYSVLVEGDGIARTQGVVHLAGPGRQASLLSEPPGPSLGLLTRSLNYPGLPAMTTARVPRGVVFATAATGALFAAGRAHFRYRDRLDEPGAYASDRVRDEKKARDRWVNYGAAVWALSALDYWIRPRLGLQEQGPDRLTLVAPPVSRTAVVWRSAVVPGAGQEFSNHRVRGLIWLGATVASAAGFVIAEHQVERNQTKVDWAKALADSAGPAEQPTRLLEFGARRNDLDASEDFRRGFRITTMLLYAANVVDAAFVPLSTPVAALSPKLSTSIPVDANGPFIAVTLRF